MDSPFILFDDTDIAFFRTLDALRTYIESPDVADLLAVNREGRIVRLYVEEQPTSSAGLFIKVTKVRAEQGDDRIPQDQFESRLRTFLRAVNVEVPGSASIDELIAALEFKIGYTN